MAFRIDDSVLEINNDPVLVVANSVKTKKGRGTVKVENMTRGNGSSEIVTSVDTSTKIGMVKFDIPATIEGFKQLDAWHLNKGKNVCRVTFVADGKQIVEYYPTMSVTNDPDKETGVDGKVSVEMSGGQAQ
jgi:hypothetical protein